MTRSVAVTLERCASCRGTGQRWLNGWIVICGACSGLGAIINLGRPDVSPEAQPLSVGALMHPSRGAPR
jgi:hypothetical protein